MTVHVVVAPDATLAGAHASADRFGAGATVTVAVRLPPSVAVTVTVWEVVTTPAVAVNVADVAPAGTTAEVGTGSTAVVLDASPTVLPPVGAG